MTDGKPVTAAVDGVTAGEEEGGKAEAEEARPEDAGGRTVLQHKKGGVEVRGARPEGPRVFVRRSSNRIPVSSPRLLPYGNVTKGAIDAAVNAASRCVRRAAKPSNRKPRFLILRPLSARTRFACRNCPTPSPFRTATVNGLRTACTLPAHYLHSACTRRSPERPATRSNAASAPPVRLRRGNGRGASCRCS